MKKIVKQEQKENTKMQKRLKIAVFVFHKKNRS